MGGGTISPSVAVSRPVDLSPRGRGNLPRRKCCGASVGSIPAWAGEPGLADTTPGRAGVYPRVGGGTGLIPPGQCAGPGLSPRGRGNLADALPSVSHSRSIPAWAGEPPMPSKAEVMPPVYPRVGGGTATLNSVDAHGPGLSPRGRGNPGISFSLLLAGRSIPAWAGEPLLSVCWLFHVQVYPRVGGGTG